MKKLYLILILFIILLKCSIAQSPVYNYEFEAFEWGSELPNLATWNITARDYIELISGFETEDGAEFLAEITTTECDPTTIRSSQTAPSEIFNNYSYT